MKMNKFKTGDRCIIVNTPFSNLNGKKVTIESDGELMYNEFNLNGAIIYAVDIFLARIDPCDFVGVAEQYLRPIYDGDEKSSWEDMKDLWEPKELEKCPSESVIKEVDNA